jgi:hypothetical protein
MRKFRAWKLYLMIDEIINRVEYNGMNKNPTLAKFESQYSRSASIFGVNN